MIDGDSCYHVRHGKGHFKGLLIPVGALVEFMPQDDIATNSFGSKTIEGIILGYHVQSGGFRNGDYIVADYEPFKKACDVLESKVDIHRIKEVLKNLNGAFTCPVAEMRAEMGTHRTKLRRTRRCAQRRRIKRKRGRPQRRSGRGAICEGRGSPRYRHTRNGIRNVSRARRNMLRAKKERIHATSRHSTRFVEKGNRE